MSIYIQCFVIAFLGMVLQVILKIHSIQKKSEKANIKMTVLDYFKQDFLVLIASLITIAIFLFLVDNMINLHAKAIDYVKFFFAFVGYTGSDLLLRLFSVANKKVNDIIDQKTTIADSSTGSLNVPTELPKNAAK